MAAPFASMIIILRHYEQAGRRPAVCISPEEYNVPIEASPTCFLLSEIHQNSSS